MTEVLIRTLAMAVHCSAAFQKANSTRFPLVPLSTCSPSVDPIPAIDSAPDAQTDKINGVHRTTVMGRDEPLLVHRTHHDASLSLVYMHKSADDRLSTTL